MRVTTAVVATVATVAGLLGPMSPASAATKLKVTLAASQSSYVGGEPVVLRGKVTTERRVRRKVLLEAALSRTSGWETLARARTNRKGKYAFRFAAPNPATAATVRFRVRVKPTKATRLRLAWRKGALSPVAKVRFNPGPGGPAPLPTLALPTACATAEPGVQALTVECLAAMEVQVLERSWRDSQRILALFRSPTRMLELGLALGWEEPDTAAEEYAALTLLMPLTMEVIPEATFVDRAMTIDQVMTSMFASIFAGEVFDQKFGNVTPKTPWQQAWTDWLLLTDTSSVVLNGDRATMPKRRFGQGELAGTLTFGGEWIHANGAWVQFSAALRAARRETRGAVQREAGQAPALRIPWS